MNSPVLTVISDEISQDLPDLVRFGRQFGLDGFELRSLGGRAFKDLTREDIAAVRAVCRDEGWKIHGCATPVFKCPIDDEAAIREHLEIFKRSLDTARALDCGLVRVFSFLRRPAPIDDATARRVADWLRTLLELAAGSGVRVGLENESSCIVGSGTELLKVVALLPRENFGAIWDACNVLYVPEAPLPVTGNFAELLPWVIHIHVKDAIRRAPSPVPVPVGLGDVGWREHFAEIRRLGYRGVFSLETHWREEQIDEKLLHLPAGYAFSKGGEAATATCIRNVRSLWAAAP